MIVGRVKANKQVLVSFSIGKNKDEVKYFVMLLQCMRVTYYWASHGNLIGRPLMTGVRIGILCERQ
jgi:hypothetical protein